MKVCFCGKQKAMFSSLYCDDHIKKPEKKIVKPLKKTYVASVSKGRSLPYAPYVPRAKKRTHLSYTCVACNKPLDNETQTYTLTSGKDIEIHIGCWLKLL